MTPEQLIEGFVHETKLYQLSSRRKSDAALDKKIALGEEIVRRGGCSSLMELMENSDPYIADSAGAALVKVPEFQERALVVLDRIADGQLGSASGLADSARNFIRYGNPDGEPVEVEKELAAIRARYERG